MAASRRSGRPACAHSLTFTWQVPNKCAELLQRSIRDQREDVKAVPGRNAAGHERVRNHTHSFAYGARPSRLARITGNQCGGQDRLGPFQELSLPPADELTVQMRDGTRRSGRFIEATEERLSIKDGQKILQFKRPEVWQVNRSIPRQRKASVVTGAVIGGCLGIVGARESAS